MGDRSRARGDSSRTREGERSRAREEGEWARARDGKRSREGERVRGGGGGSVRASMRSDGRALALEIALTPGGLTLAAGAGAGSGAGGRYVRGSRDASIVEAVTGLTGENTRSASARVGIALLKLARRLLLE